MSQKWQVFDADANPEIDRCRYAATADEAHGLIIRGEAEPIPNERRRRWLRELAPRDSRPDFGPTQQWPLRPAASLQEFLIEANVGITDRNVPQEHARLVRKARCKVKEYGGAR